MVLINSQSTLIKKDFVKNFENRAMIAQLSLNWSVDCTYFLSFITKLKSYLFDFDFGLIVSQVNVPRPRHIHVTISVLIICHNAKVDGPVTTVFGEYITALALEMNHFLIKCMVVRVPIDASFLRFCYF